MRLAEAVVGLRQAVVLGMLPTSACGASLADPRRIANGMRGSSASWSSGRPNDVLREDPRAAAGGEVTCARRRSWRSTAMSIALLPIPSTTTRLPASGPRPVVVGVDLLPSKSSRPGNAGSGQRGSQWWPLATSSASKRSPVAVVERRASQTPSAPRGRARRPSRSGSCRGSRSGRRRRRSTRRSACGAGSRDSPRHREVRVLHPLARRVDVQRAVGRRHPVAVAEDPVAADAVGRLEDGRTGCRARAAPWRRRCRTSRRR